MSNGLDVWAARRGGAALSEVRLVIPLGGLGADASSDATARLTAELLFSEAAGPAAAEAGSRLAALGFSARASAGAGTFSVGLSGLDDNLAEALAIVADVLGSTSFDADQVAQRAGRIAAQLELEGADPGRIAHDRLRRLLFGGHAYGRTLSDPSAVAATESPAADAFARTHLVPSRSHLVVVSPRDATEVLSEAESSMKVWGRSGEATPVPDPPDTAPDTFGHMLVLDRPDSVQTAFWFASRTSGRGAPDHAALTIAVLVLQKRVYDNIRRRNAWSYAAGSQLIDLPKASYCMLGCPVRTEVTMPAYAELLYEMNRMIASPISVEELEEAVGALQGRTAQRLGSRSGLAEELCRLAEAGSTIRVLADETAALSSVTADEVMETSRRWLAPSRTAFVAVGKAETLQPLLGIIGPVRAEPV
ncbi:MAG TPA: insulinase family protein [Acidimicrobiales bacterium]|nr:insulinase family protein [Acidimicrobiales bacterium]